MPLPEMDPLHYPPPSAPKQGWTVHLDILEDLQPMVYKQYDWSYGVFDDVSAPHPLQDRNEPDKKRDDEDDGPGDEGRHPQHRSRAQSVWGRLFAGRARSRESRSERGHSASRGRSRNRNVPGAYHGVAEKAQVSLKNSLSRKSLSPVKSPK